MSIMGSDTYHQAFSWVWFRKCSECESSFAVCTTYMLKYYVTPKSPFQPHQLIARIHPEQWDNVFGSVCFPRCTVQCLIEALQLGNKIGRLLESQTQKWLYLSQKCSHFHSVKLKADRPHPRDYPQTPPDLQTQTVTADADGRTDGWMLPSAFLSPWFAVDKEGFEAWNVAEAVLLEERLY